MPLVRQVKTSWFGALVAAATWFGAIGNTASAAEDMMPLRVNADGRALTDPQGRPVFLLADTAWSLVLRASREDAEEYLRKRKSQGFNAVTFVLFAPGRNELTGTLTNHYGDAPFALVANRPDPTKPTLTPGHAPDNAQEYDYWDHVDYVVALARRIGVYAIMLPTWGSGVAGSYDGKDTREILFSVENAGRYGSWLAARYREQPHVLWMMGGDRAAVAGEKDYRPVIRAMAEAIASAAPDQLISYHSRKGAPQSAEWFHADSWLGFNSNQEWPEQQVRNIAADWARQPAKPTWLFEGRYEGYWRGNYKAEQWGEWQVRQQAYQTVFAGAFGHTYGHERVFGFGQDGADWKQHLDSPGARSMTHLARLMSYFPADDGRSRVPDSSLLDADPGLPERLKSNYIAATRSTGGNRAMFYAANGRPIRVKLDRLPARTFFAFWFNPREGTWRNDTTEHVTPAWFARDINGGPGGVTREFVAPSQGDGEDWVLVLSQDAL